MATDNNGLVALQVIHDLEKHLETTKWAGPHVRQDSDTAEVH